MTAQLSIANLIKNIDELVADAAPNEHEVETRAKVEDFLFSAFKTTFGADSYLIGSSLSRVTVPEEIVEVTQLLPKTQCDKWCDLSNKTLIAEANRIYTTELGASAPLEEKVNVSIDVEKISLSLRGNHVTTTINGLQHRVSPNNLSSIYLTAVFEETNDIIGMDSLLKRCFMLIKLWCHFESRRFMVKRKYLEFY